MNIRSRRTPEPPPSGDDLDPLPPGEGERSMSRVAAVGWTAGVTLLFLWLLVLVVSARPAAQFDLISSFGCQAIAYLLGLFGVLRVYAPHASIREFVGARGTHPAFFGLAVALGLTLAGPINALYEVIEQRWPSGRDDAELLRIVSEASVPERVAFGLIFVALGPALEEIFFRGALVRPLRRRYEAAAVVVVTAMLFSVAHIEPQKFLPIGLFGVVLGVLRVVSGSLLPPILLHATYNGILYAAVLAAAGAEAGGDGPAAARWDAPLPPWLLVASSACAAVLLALACLLGSRTEGAARAKEKDAS